MRNFITMGAGDIGPSLRLGAAEAIWRISGDSERILDTVMESYHSSHSFDRKRAVLLLGELNLPDREVVPLLEKALEDEYWRVQQAADEALKKRESRRLRGADESGG